MIIYIKKSRYLNLYKFIYMLKNDEKLRYEQSRTNQIVCKEFDCKVVNQKMFEIYSMVKMKGNEYE